jgi:hypothetical protein
LEEGDALHWYAASPFVFFELAGRIEKIMAAVETINVK